MKTTMKAVLTDLTNEQKTLLDHMMLVFCTAIRYSFKRQLEGQVIGDLEKVVAHKYNLNIRQAKDAVESARQTIVSQHELVKLYHGNYSKKVEALDKTVKNRAVKVLMPIYLPQKLSKKTGKVNGVHYRKLFMDSLERGEAYQVELIKRDGKYYAHITFEELEAKVIYTGHLNMIGIDTNPDGFALTKINNNGNYQGHTYLKQHELTFCRSNRRTNLCGELVKQAVDTVITKHCGIAAADLKFKDDSDVSSKLARVSSQFVYSTLLTILERNCRRNGVEFVKVKPQYTSKIGLYKYCHQYGLDVHNGAALVIARRSYGLKETVPKLLREKLVSKKNLTPFNQTNEWGQWSEISKQVNKLFKKGKEVNTPGLWLVRRKLLLGIA